MSPEVISNSDAQNFPKVEQYYKNYKQLKNSKHKLLNFVRFAENFRFKQKLFDGNPLLFS